MEERIPYYYLNAMIHFEIERIKAFPALKERLLQAGFRQFKTKGRDPSICFECPSPRFFDPIIEGNIEMEVLTYRQALLPLLEEIKEARGEILIEVIAYENEGNVDLALSLTRKTILALASIDSSIDFDRYQV